MSGVKYLLDTNFILGMLKATPETTQWVSQRGLLADECAYSAITRMELLGFPGITLLEDQLIRSRLSSFAYLPITAEIEDATIALRCAKKIKLPDAIIAATASQHGLDLLTFDATLLATIAKT
ncbi:MAG: type II toxin-antitoxin system VapC family toxin [Rhodoferax sp.]|nr:type II toxin-antitoxin system VapC family toxin [Rhodoferax sp.]